MIIKFYILNIKRELEPNNYMNYLREAVLERVSLRELALIIALAGLASFLPFFIHIQWLVGPIVNAILIIVLFEL